MGRYLSQDGYLTKLRIVACTGLCQRRVTAAACLRILVVIGRKSG
jgi:hypothetical protein